MAAKAKRVRTSAPGRNVSLTRQKAREERAVAARRALYRVAHEWVSSVRSKIADLIQAAYALDNLAYDPDSPKFMYGIASLSTIMRLPEVASMLRDLERAEQTAARLLVSREGCIPPITEAVKEADAAIKAAWPA